MTQTLPDQPRPRFSLLLYLGVSMTAFFPSLFLGKAYFANDLLHQYSHFRGLLRSQLLSGHFPLWNPYFLGGQPFFADPNVMMCYPLNYLTVLFPVAYGFGVFYCLHMFLAAAGTHFWLKSLKLSENACRVGALAFCLSGFFWWELIHPPILAVFAWFPWVLGCLERLCRTWKSSWAFLSGLVFALVFTCGNFQSTTCVLYTSLAYFFFRALTGTEPGEPSPLSRGVWKKFPIVLLFALWGSLPLFTHLVPANEFSKLSNRRAPGQTYENFMGTFSMRPSSTYEFLFPTLGVEQGDTLENAIQGITDQTNIDNAYLGAFGYLGIWAPFVAFFAFYRKDRKFLWFLLAISLAAVAVGWGRYFPLHKILCAILPGMDLSRAPFRNVQTYVLFVCALMAFGFQTLERWAAEKGSGKSPWMGLAAYTLLVAVIGLFNAGQSWRELLALGFGAAGFYCWCLTEDWKTLGRLLFQAALILPLLISGWSAGFSLGPNSNYDLERNFPAFSLAKNHPKPGRFYFDDGLLYPVQAGGTPRMATFPQDAPMELGIRAANGYNPIHLKDSDSLQTVPMKNYLSLLGVQGLFFGRSQGEAKDFKLQQMAGVFFYEPLDPCPPVTAPTQVLSMPDSLMRLSALRSPDFDPREKAFLSESLSPELQTKLSGKKALLQTQQTRDDLNHLSYSVRLDRDSLVVFSEVVFPGWKAFLDGSPASLLTANQVFRSLFVPAGEHQVEFRYEPSWAKPLLFGLILWLVSAIAYGIFLFRRKPEETVKAS